MNLQWRKASRYPTQQADDFQQRDKKNSYIVCTLVHLFFRRSSKGSELQGIRERRGGKSCLIWVFSNGKAQKNSIFFYQSSFDTSFSL